MGENVSAEKEFSLRNIFFLIRKYFILIIAIVVVSGAVGFVYTKAQTPVYTASETVSYVARITESSTEINSSDINVMTAYIDTVVDFCVTGSVINRANYYYNEYLKKDGAVTIDSFIEQTKEGSPDYTVDENLSYYNKDNITSALVSNKNDKFVFNISMQKQATKSTPKEDNDELRDMIRIYVLACDVESRNAFGSGNVTTYIHEWVGSTDNIVVTSNISTTKNVAIALLIGCVLAFLVVLLIYLFDNTVTDIGELERITDSHVLSYISDQEK